MNKLRIASAVAALTSALAIPAWGADATNAAKDGASNIDQPVQQSGTGDGANGTGPAGSNANQAKARKHPPTSAMDSATRNAGDLIKKLTLRYNRQRQANITKELIEIISGAEAL